MSDRLRGLTSWVKTQLDLLAIIPLKLPLILEPVSGDASFRRYFRVPLQQGSLIVMDAPPNKESSEPFVRLAEHWLDNGICVPEIMAHDLQNGFLLLSDFGDTQYLAVLNSTTADKLYQQAIKTLVQIQQCSAPSSYVLPHYDKQKLLDEMQLCPQWFLADLLGLKLLESEHCMLNQAFSILVDSALEQPVLTVHRDYHSRNLMLKHDQGVGVLDFQDAVSGPITYDLVSMLRDCYINWSQPQELRWIKLYLQQAHNAGLFASPVSLTQFIRWFDLMGLQRHLKCVGIFSRLHIRDGKTGYLKDIPRTFGYIKQVCSIYPELTQLEQWLNSTVIPRMHKLGYVAVADEPQGVL